MPGFSCWPRRSEPLAGNRIKPRNEPTGMVGSVTASSVDLGPLGAVLANQISHQSPAGPVTLRPVAWSLADTAGGSPAGGAPAGADLYCARPMDEAQGATARQGSRRDLVSNLA